MENFQNQEVKFRHFLIRTIFFRIVFNRKNYFRNDKLGKFIFQEVLKIRKDKNQERKIWDINL